MQNHVRHSGPARKRAHPGMTKNGGWLKFESKYSQDAAIYFAPYAGLTRVSIRLRKKCFGEDGLPVKPGNDDCVLGAMRHSSAGFAQSGAGARGQTDRPQPSIALRTAARP